jgi:hypothetical protein
MHATRFLPALALLVFLPVRADDSTPKSSTPADAKKSDGSMSCCAGEEAKLCPKAKEAANPAAKTKRAAKKAPATPESAAKPAAATAASLVAVKDPVTGQLRAPTAEEMEKLNALRPQAAPLAPQVVVLPNGTKMLRLGPESTSYAIARKNPDGSLTEICVEGAEAAAAAQRSPAPAPAPRKEER